LDIPAGQYSLCGIYSVYRKPDELKSAAWVAYTGVVVYVKKNLSILRNNSSAPYALKHNGTAEQMNRTRTEKVGCMVLHVSACEALWASALNTAVLSRLVLMMCFSWHTSWETSL
jgi:hypothetical protein